jgi:hypothetical protein
MMGKPLTRTPPPPPPPLKVEWLGGSELRQGPLIWRGGPPSMEINVGVNGGQVLGGERSKSSEWDEWR